MWTGKAAYGDHRCSLASLAYFQVKRSPVSDGIGVEGALRAGRRGSCCGSSQPSRPAQARSSMAELSPHKTSGAGSIPAAPTILTIGLTE